MKNIKKSLLVVPALGVLMLAAAGSVGGTVAWFSSVSTFNTRVSSFGVGRLEGNLSCEVAAANGTVANGTNAVAVGKQSIGDAFLTHGSVNHTAADGAVWTLDGSSSSVAYKAVSSPWLYSTSLLGGKYWYHAVSWTMSFEYKYGADITATKLYLSSACEITAEKVNSGDTENTFSEFTKLGFRIAFIANGSDSTGTLAPMVWAPFVESATASAEGAYSGYTYVTGTSATASYTTSNFAYGEASFGTYASPATGTTPQVGYLGTFGTGTANTSKTLNYTCIAWFEGTDANIVDDALMQKVTASLVFYTSSTTGS